MQSISQHQVNDVSRDVPLKGVPVSVDSNRKSVGEQCNNIFQNQISEQEPHKPTTPLSADRVSNKLPISEYLSSIRRICWEIFCSKRDVSVIQPESGRQRELLQELEEESLEIQTEEVTLEEESLEIQTEEVTIDPFDRSEGRQQEREQVSGLIWECVGIQDLEKGKIYQYHVRNEIVDPGQNRYLQNLLIRYKSEAESFPAIESDPEALNKLIGPEKTLEEIFEEIDRKDRIEHGHWDEKIRISLCNDQKEKAKKKDEEQKKDPDRSVHGVMHQLGFNYFYQDGYHLELPNAEALREKWKKLQDKYPEMGFPEIKLVDSEGIADDRTFVNTYCTATALISTKGEFVHDITAHVIPLLFAIVRQRFNQTEEVSLEVVKEKMERFIVSSLNTIDQAKSMIALEVEVKPHMYQSLAFMEIALGAIIDSYNSTSSLLQISYLLNRPFSHSIDKLIQSPSWQKYCKERLKTINVPSYSGEKNSYSDDSEGQVQDTPHINFEDLRRDWKYIFNLVKQSSVIPNESQDAESSSIVDDSFRDQRQDRS